METNFEMTVSYSGNRQNLNVIVKPVGTVWDAVAAAPYGNNGYVAGRGDFDVDGYRIMAHSMTFAKRIAIELNRRGIYAR